jgi:exopolysaccharide biosynthesis polyprenyl glycosylphosphotransferase
MLRQYSTKRIVAFALFDWLGTLALLALAGPLRTRLGVLPAPLMDVLEALKIPIGGLVRETALSAGTSAPLFIAVAIIWPFFFVVFSVYDGRQNETLRTELRNVATAVTMATLVLAGVLYLTYRDTSRVQFLIFFALDLALLTGGRVLLWSYRRSQGQRGSTDRPTVLIVGAGPVGQGAVRELQKYASADLRLVGYLDDDPGKQGQILERLPVLGTLDQVAQVVAMHGIQNAVVALPLQAHDRLLEMCRTLQGLSVHVHVIPDLFALLFPNAELDGFGGIPVIDLGQPSLHGRRRYTKRAFDVAVSGLILLLTWPLLLAIAAWIKLDSRGPALFRQVRIGENGRPFTMVKYRSMVANADPKIHEAYATRLIQKNVSLHESGQASLKLAVDPRITRAGRILRKTSLDELPQFFNVIKGDMSLVGPRPPLPYEVAVYQDWHKRRLEAIPGMTGLWQVEGRNQVSFDEMVRLDLAYIERQSLGLDLMILLKTPLSMFAGRGAG